MRGTGYAVVEIIWWMLAAAIVGGAIGWILRRSFGNGAGSKEAEAKLESQRSRYAEISAELGDWKVKGKGLIADLEARTTDAEAGAARVKELETDLVGARDELETLQAAHAGCDVAADEHAGQLAALQGRIADSDAANQELRAQLAAPAVTDLDAPEAMNTISATPPTRFGTAGSDHRDDLKVINGIGKKMEATLNGYGIESWEQLAELTASDVATVDEALEEFPGRIQRDEWVEQARDLVERFPDKADRPNRKTLLNEPPS